MTISFEDQAFDANHIWHPYTNLNKPSPVFSVDSAEGVYLNLSNGEKLVDGMASWWSAIHGYNHPYLNQAITDQTQKMSHVMFGGLTHKPAIDLAKKLIEMTSDNLDCVFFADSGSVAVEVALKMAIQYWFSKDRFSKAGLSKDELTKNGLSRSECKKNRFIALKGGYHGDTFGAMSVCDPDNGMHSMFKGALSEHYFVKSPSCTDDENWQIKDIEEFSETIKSNADQLAAVILEPLVQGAGGMNFYCPEYLRQIRRLCDENNVLLILDEIATGFGRTGSLFAYEQAQITADILCVGKALTGGMMTLGATLCSREIADVIGQFGDGNLMHGPTFMGNPLACAVANASLELLSSSNWKNQVANIENQLKTELEVCRQYSSVADVRVKGAIGVIELKSSVDMQQIQPRLVELGVWIRPFGKLLYIMPPYIIKERELSLLTKAMNTVALELSKS